MVEGCPQAADFNLKKSLIVLEVRRLAVVVGRDE
jgi:hypothetical protein